MPPELAAAWGSVGGRWPRGAAEGKRRKVPRDTKGPWGRGGGAGGGSGRGRGAAGSLETREAARGWASPRGRSPRVGSGPTQSSGQPSCWRVTPLSVAATGGGGTVGNPEYPGFGGEGYSTVVSTAVAFLGVLCPVLLLPISAGWPQFFSPPSSPPHCHIAFPCGFLLNSLPYFSPTPSGASGILPSARRTFANDRMPDLF